MNQERIITATILTKSNFGGLNGKQVKVIKFLGTIVYCEYIDIDGTPKRADFSINELTKINESWI
jgi:hypothetical protein